MFHEYGERVFMDISARNYRLALVSLLLASFVVNLGFSALSPVFPYLILAFKGLLTELPELVETSIEAHKGAMEFGILTAAFMLTRAPTAGVVGFISDVFGRKKTILIGMSLYFAVSTGFLFSNDIWLFTLFRALQGVASAMVWPVAEAYLADITPRWRRGKAISMYTASMTVAEIIGPGVGIVIYKVFITWFGETDVLAALKSPIIFLAVTCLISLAILFFLPPVSAVGEGSTGRSEIGFKDVFKTLRSVSPSISRGLKAIYFNGAINGVAVGIVETATIVYIIEKVAKDPLYIGVFSTLMALGSLPTMLIAGYISDKMKTRKPIILLGYIIGRSSFFLIPLIRDCMLLLLVGLMISLIFGLSTPIMRALQADLISSTIRGTVFGIQQLFFNIGIFAGALVGGWLSETFAPVEIILFGSKLSGYIVPFWISGGLAMIGTIVFAVYVEERK